MSLLRRTEFTRDLTPAEKVNLSYDLLAQAEGHLRIARAELSDIVQDLQAEIVDARMAVSENLASIAEVNDLLDSLPTS